jgi:hypothetical protein
MRAENETNDPVDYDQSGGGGDVDPEEQGRSDPGNPQGRLQPGETSQPFVPRGRPPWQVTFVDTRTGRTCNLTGITNPHATVKVSSFNPCDVSDS